jgi:hypothetical protein
MTSRAAAVLLGVTAATLAVTIVVAAPARQDPAPPASAVRSEGHGALASSETALHVSPDGTGDCTVSSPCSFAAALRSAHPATDISLAAGDYRPLTVPAGRGGITIEGPPSGGVMIERLQILADGVSVRGVSISDGMTLSGSGGTVTDLRAGSMAIHGNDVTIRDSDVGGTVDKDPMQITAGAADVTIEDNHIHDGARGPGQGHVDCLQITSGTRIVVRGNDVRGCSNSAILVKPDLGPIEDVRIEDNTLVSCRPRTSQCQGSVALYVRSAGNPIAGIAVVGNRIEGSTSFDSISTLRLERNTLDTYGRGPGCAGTTIGNRIRHAHVTPCPLGPGDVYDAGA